MIYIKNQQAFSFVSKALFPLVFWKKIHIEEIMNNNKAKSSKGRNILKLIQLRVDRDLARLNSLQRVKEL